MYVTLTPAYGADYRSKTQVQEAWKAGKDFIRQCFYGPYDGKPMNREQMTAGEKYSIRYDKLRKTVNVS